ncbi:hypothetical protein A0J61_10477, partial [Choanephora cucurbitarum]
IAKQNINPQVSIVQQFDSACTRFHIIGVIESILYHLNSDNPSKEKMELILNIHDSKKRRMGVSILNKS